MRHITIYARLNKACSLIQVEFATKFHPHWTEVFWI